MTESRNRDLATSIGAAVASDNIATDGTLAISGVVTYTNLSDLPSSGVSAGDLGFVTANNGLYIRGSSGWYVIALVNTSPTYSTPPASSYDLAKDGSTTTAITIVATDPEGFTITYSVTADSGFNGLATVSQSSNVFTVTPKAEGVATTESGTLTFRATDGVNNTDVVSTFTLTFASAVQNSAETVLLAKASGNSGTNSSFTDNSSNSHTITTAGNTLASSFSPYRSGDYSNYLGTATSYIRTASSADFDIGGTGDWSYEAWIYVPIDHTFQNYTRGFGLGPYYSNVKSFGFMMSDAANSNNMTVYWDYNTRHLISSVSFDKGQWNHVCISRTGTNIALFYNGLRIAHNGSYTTSISTGNTYAFLGHTGNGTEGFVGYITDARFINGSHPNDASQESFTLPNERLTAVTNTKLLIDGVPYLSDESSSNHSLTLSGTVNKEPFAPYDYNPYSASNHGGSALFDGTGDYLSIADSTDFTLGSGDFTAECWVYPTASPSQPVIFGQWSNPYSWAIEFSNDSNRNVRFLINDGTIRDNVSSTSVPLNNWAHLALVRNGSTFTMYVNGVSVDTYTSSASLVDATGPVTIGAQNGGGSPYQGYITDARLVKGTAVYTSAFTPSTEPLSAVTNTSLLALQGDASIFDAAQINDITLNGDASSSTAQTKNASSSIYFDGSGDSITIPWHDGFNFGSGDFTIEMWYNLSDVEGLISWGSSSSNRFDITGISNNLIRVLYNHPSYTNFDNRNGSDALPNTWQHFACVRHGDTLTYYIDGVLQGTQAFAAGALMPVDTANGITIGARRYATTAGDLSQGYFEDVRLTKGLARYPFVPPEETLTAITNTVLLACHSDSLTADGSGNHTLTSHGNVAVSNYAPFTGGKSIYFDGTGDYISIPTSTDWDINTTNYTFEAWVSIADGDTSYNTIFSTHEPNSPYYGWEVDITNSGQLGYWTKGTGGTADYLTSGFGPTINDGQWHHVAATWSSSTIKLFVDGGLVYSTTNAPLDNTAQDTTVYIGRDGNTTAGRPFGGYISNLRIVKGSLVYTNSFTPPTAQLEG